MRDTRTSGLMRGRGLKNPSLLYHLRVEIFPTQRR